MIYYTIDFVSNSNLIFDASFRLIRVYNKTFKMGAQQDESCNDSNETESLELTDLDIDCLENVFRFLDLEDLLNISDANKYFKRCTEMIFARRYDIK